MPPLIKVTQSGSFDKTEQYLRGVDTDKIPRILEKYGPKGVQALSQATPQDTGLTARSWYYEIIRRTGYASIRWRNSNINDGASVAILLQYGHGTRNGGWIEGHDYIMPAIQPIFDQILAEVMKEVTKQ